MSEEERKLIEWFDEIAGKIPRSGLQVGNGYSPEATWFLAEGESALRAGFPASHTLCRQWEKTVPRVHDHKVVGPRNDAFYVLVSIFESARDQLKRGRRGDFTSVVQRATEEDFLGVATDLHATARVAAAVLAGGALEVHLRGLCERHRAKVDGDGKIEKYKAALQHANAIDPTDAKHVTAWGGLRNDAAHKPDQFLKDRSVEDVRLMIEGVRQFIARTT